VKRFAAVALIVAGSVLLAQDAADPKAVFREPFTLRLRVDKDHFYEERYERKIPYVFKNDVYLFVGEKFGINIGFKNNQVEAITYSVDLKKADVTLEFREDKLDKNHWGTKLTIENRTKKRLIIDGLMTVPERKGIYKTSILPVEAKLSNFESWPHPIVQLVLTNIRTTKNIPAKLSPSATNN
jgi:hypothetical protein